ncbi:MAG: M48 family metalloprotease [Nitrososphaerales archaeon]
MRGALQAVSDYFLYLTFKVRRLLLRILVVMAVVPGIFIFQLPPDMRLMFAYVYVSVMGLGLYSVANVYAGSLIQLFCMTLFGRKYKTYEYSTPETEHLKAKMGLPRVRVFVTNNPRVRSPFTDVISQKVYLTTKWLDEFSEKDVQSTLGHEFGHAKTRLRFALEAGGVVAVTLLTGFALSFHTIPLVAEITEFSVLVLGLTFVSWRNERRADMISATELGPEGMISVLEQLRSQTKRDEGSETHPPLSDRITRLLPLLDKS